MIPVYLIKGFLDSGKTDFIGFTISQDYFSSGERTLLVVCEEGEQEYEPKLLKKTNTILEIIEDEEDFTPEALSYLAKKNNCSRVIVEYNGMWNHKNIQWPVNFVVEQQITLIDATTFTMYYTNMKSMVADMVRNSEMIIFNRCDSVMDDLPTFKRNVKAVNPQADIVFEGSKGEINMTLDEDLPYDINADVIELDDSSYGIWYLDIMENPARYEGKTVTYVGLSFRPRKFPKEYFVIGRMAMTCCADDMAFLGYAVHYEGCKRIKDKTWLKVTAKIKTEFFSDYKGEGPVLYATDVALTSAPEKEVIDFS